MLPTCRVHCAIFDNDGSPVAGAVVTAKLDRFEVYQGYVVPDIETATTDETGACTLALWPNALGATASSYAVKIVAPNGRTQRLTVTVPNVADANLHEIANLPPYEGKPDGQLIIDAAVAAVAPAVAAKIAAQAAQAAAELANQGAADAAATALAHRDAAAASAQQAASSAADSEADRQATAADRQQTGLDLIATSADRTAVAGDRTAVEQLSAQVSTDAAATAADRVQTGLDAVATAADRVQTGLDAATSTAAAGTATGAAAAALTSANDAALSATAAAASAADADAAKIASEVARDAAIVAQNNAVAVVTGGTATLVPAAGKIPLADANAKIAEGWLTSTALVEQTDIGTAPNEIPLNQYLGNLAYMNSDQFVLNPVASATPIGVGDLVFQLTNDTTLVVKVKGSDGTVRSATLTLA